MGQEMWFVSIPWRRFEIPEGNRDRETTELPCSGTSSTTDEGDR